MATESQKKRWRQRVRVFGLEGVQNYPLLLGLLVSLRLSPFAAQIAALAAGGFGTAFLIAVTDHLKALEAPASSRWRDMLANLAIISITGALYLLYRASAISSLVLDGFLGIVAGGSVGILQAVSLGQRRISRADLLHAAGLGLAGACILALLWLLTAIDLHVPVVWIALALDIPMTVSIVLVEYRSLL